MLEINKRVNVARVFITLLADISNITVTEKMAHVKTTEAQLP